MLIMSFHYCRGACAPCPIMVTISCACGETHFEVRVHLSQILCSLADGYITAFKHSDLLLWLYRILV